MDNRVACDCNGLRGTGHFEVDGDWLILKSTLGEHRVRVGVLKPRKLAARLLKNLCAKAAAAAPPNASEPTSSVPSVSDRAQALVDAQRDKLIAMASDDPQGAAEENILDQMIANERVIDTAVQSLAPIAPNAVTTASPIESTSEASPLSRE